jgi:NADH-quinone oxidoreductase subunit A
MSYFFQYYILLVFVTLSLLFTLVLTLLSFLVSPKFSSLEKSTSYECGFEPFGDARSSLNIQFYIVGVLFIIFDLEVVFLLP